MSGGGQAHADTQDLGRTYAVHFEQVSRERFDLGEHRVRALADVEGLLAPGDGHRGEITERDVRTRRADVNAEDEAGPRLE